LRPTFVQQKNQNVLSPKLVKHIYNSLMIPYRAQSVKKTKELSILKGGLPLSFNSNNSMNPTVIFTQ